MNRSDFFKKLGLGVLAVAVAPKMLADEKPNIDIPDDQISRHGKFQWHEPNYMPTPEDIIRHWEQTGDVLYLPYDPTICINDIYTCGGEKWQVMWWDHGKYICMPLRPLHSDTKAI